VAAPGHGAAGPTALESAAAAGRGRTIAAMAAVGGGRQRRHGPSGRTVVVYLAAAAGLAASITILFLSMRAVMNVGGFCAEGGPYEIAVHCPEGVGLLFPVGFLGGFACAFVMYAAGESIGTGYGALATLAWPAVFLSTGWNFLEYGVFPPAGADGPVIAWIGCGVVFWIMGGAPLVVALGAVGAAGRRPRGGPPVELVAEASVGERPPAAPPPTINELLAAPVLTAVDEPAPPGTPDEALAADLEHLDGLHRSGALDDVEFEAAKRRRLGLGPQP